MNEFNPNQESNRTVVNGVQGTWVPVNDTEIPDEISTDPTRPSLGTDGGYYYADPYMPQGVSGQGPSPIAANQHNAIPTPSSIVQLPPIVQPISLVPYASQNQPLVQYDPNYRPSVPETATPEPAYKRNPYPGVSTFVALLSLGAIVVACLLAMWNSSSALVALKSFIMDGGLNNVLNGDLSDIYTVVLCALYALSLVFTLIVLLQALICLGKSKPLPKFNFLTLIALLLSIVAIVIMFIEEYTVGLGAYIYSGLLLVAMLFTLGINKNAMVIDYVASKQTFVK